MSERPLLQRLAGLVADLASDVADFAAPEVREAVLADLGGRPGTGTAVVLPPAALESIRTYRDAVDPDAQADAEAIGNIALLLGAIIDQVEAWDAGWPERGEAFAHALLDLVGSNYLRRKSPRWFLMLQAIVTAIELTDSHGPGEPGDPQRSYARFWNAIKVIFKFVWNPGRTLDDLDDTTEQASGSTLVTARDQSFLVLDGALRGLIAAVAVYDQTKDDKEHRENILGDVIVGWDAAALDVDSELRPTAADVVSGRMVSLEIRFAGAEDQERLRLSWLYLPRRLGVPARPHQLFLALGGELAIDQIINPKHAADEPDWHFRADVRSDAGAAWLISGTDSQPSATAATAQVAVSWTAVPNDTGISYTIHTWPRRLGMRIELGPLAAALTLSGNGARAVVRADKSALVIDGESRDSFIRKLLGGKPFRYPFGFALGYDAQLGFIHSIYKASSTDAAGPEPPFDSSGPAGPPDLAMTLPLGGGHTLGFLNIHEVVLRLAYGGAAAPETGWAIAAGVLITFSTTLGPVYLRVDKLGLSATAETITPSSERNLRLIEAGFDAAAPQGIAIQLDTGPISGGGTIQHDPATGDYVGALVLRLGKTVALGCIGLASIKDREGNEESSLILIGTVEHLDLRVGPVVFDGFGLLYAADRRVDEAAIRAALPTGQLRQILFPADPVKHLPELASALRTFFPVQHGTHCYGILVKLYFGAGHPLIRADLALLLERDSTADKSRLILLGRISSELPQDKNAILRLNLDAIGVFDLDTKEIAADAVLYESRLCGRFVLTGAAAFRRRSGEGFALAVGGFNPRFQPPGGFPALPRITIALTAGDNPKLIVEAYFALTSNTLQFGARASLYASAYGFSIEGYAGFDVLIELWPPHFIAEFRAGVQLKRGSRNLFKVDVRGELEGPVPLRLAGKATFGILWWDYTVGFDKTLIGGSNAVLTEAVDVLAEVVARLSLVTSWRAEPLAVASQIVSLRNGAKAADVLLVHPLARLEVRQGVVPLNLDRDIDRIGAFVPAGAARRFGITAATVGGSGAATEPIFDEFADGQFFDMTAAERLAAPAFVRREAGVAFGLDGYRTDGERAVSSAFEYEEIVVNDAGEAELVPESEVEPLPPELFDRAFLVGAAARAATRTGRAQRYSEAVLADAPRLNPIRRRA